MRILSVNVGDSRPVTVKNRTIQTGIYKIPAKGPIAVSRLGLQDDVRIEVRKMGLEHSAVYAYPHEHYAYWQQQLECDPFPIGQFGENLTVTGLLEEEVRIGDIFRFGNTVLQVAHPRIPCGKLNARMGLRFAPMFLASRKVGFYMRVLTEGTVAQDDTIELLERDEASPTMEEFVRITHYEYWDTEGLKSLLQARDLMPDWREVIEAKLVRSQATTGWHGIREFEVSAAEQESNNTISLYLKCVRGRELAPFHGGQQLMVVLGERGGGSQQRKSYYLSSNPHDLSSYRINVAQNSTGNKTGTDSSVSTELQQLQVGDRIMCNAPHGAVRSILENMLEDRIAVLISEGQGIAPMLSLLYELEKLQIRARLFHESVADEPQQLLVEVSALIERNQDFNNIHVELDKQDHISARLIRDHVVLAQSDIYVAGSQDFIERLMNEFMAIDFSPAAMITYRID
ncbi:MAG: MOSC domain-containing protein [Gammaproteobacteria bacterium]|nr:MOSC domain-containing protein [Gammaproteobacteria bacterium]